MRRSRYQFGGGTDPSLYSLDNVFNAVNNYYDSQGDNQDTYQPQPDIPESTDTEDNYAELLDRYNALEDRLAALEQTRADSFVNDYGDDGFLNFLFSDDNNSPINFDLIGNSSFTPNKSNSGSMPGFQSFGSYQEGRAALENQLELYKSGRSAHTTGNETLAEATSIYAPPSENDTENYINFVTKQLGVSRDTPISQIDTKKWADAIEKIEGNRKGNNPGNLRKYEFGGIPVAQTDEELYEGLNADDEYQEMILDLPKQYNVIRGLDSGEPVSIQDEFGNQDTLYGNQDQANMYGKVYERKMQRGGLNPIYTNNPNDPRLKRYQDSLNLYNANPIPKGAFDIKPYQKFKAQISTGKINGLDSYYTGVEGDPFANDKIKPTKEYYYYTDIKQTYQDNKLANSTNLASGFAYKKPVQPVIYQNTNKEYDKKYPPIYLSNPNDPRIGKYAPEGNEYRYRKLEKLRPKIGKAQLAPEQVIPLPRIKGNNAPFFDTNKPVITDYSFSYRTPEGNQSTRYFPDFSSWQDFVKDKRYITQTVSGDKSSARTIGYLNE